MRKSKKNLEKTKMGYNKTKMAHFRPKWPELDQIIFNKLSIKIKSDLVGQKKAIKFIIYHLGRISL